ncbi:MAG: LON peptidase substrate-binding domain-containing protein, partial [Phycisphaerae bacterium]|nr:LON peptidase substrate-binding domain-containing protein [Phycisphaerae bacterium]
MQRNDEDAAAQAAEEAAPQLPTEALAGGPQTAIPDVLPILPLRETVVFPGTLAPLAVGRPMSLKMLQHTQPQSRIIGLFTQQDPEPENPGAADLHEIGTAAVILKLAREEEGPVTVLVHGLRRIRLRRLVQEQPYLRGRVEVAADVAHPGKMLEAAFKSLRESSVELVGLSAAIPEEMVQVIESVDQPGQLADFLAANLDIGLEPMVDLLEELDVAKRVRRVQILVARQLEIARLQLKIHRDVQSTITETQRRGYLREQLKAIQRELGEEGGGGEQASQLREKIQAAKPPPEVLE